jgi:formate dehydrogenase major subunit
MELSRRDFLKASGAGIGGIFLLGALSDGVALASPIRQLALKRKTSETTTICCYCAVGCGAIVSTYDDGTLKIEGDPDHPINEGSLCSKGLSMSQVHQVDGKPNPYRLTRPLYRAPGASDWQNVEWDWAIENIAKKIKATRDATYDTANSRTEAISNLGGGELDNEECYVLAKMARALGIVYLEHCARI